MIIITLNNEHFYLIQIQYSFIIKDTQHRHTHPHTPRSLYGIVYFLSIGQQDWVQVIRKNTFDSKIIKVFLLKSKETKNPQPVPVLYNVKFFINPVCLKTKKHFNDEWNRDKILTITIICLEDIRKSTPKNQE